MVRLQNPKQPGSETFRDHKTITNVNHALLHHIYKR